jgi:NAD(P)H-nitrite reductase large subunit
MQDKDEIICWCSNVTRADIENAMDEGAKTLDDIKEMTGACTICKCKEMNPKHRCCKGDIRHVMAEYLMNH